MGGFPSEDGWRSYQSKLMLDYFEKRLMSNLLFTPPINFLICTFSGWACFLVGNIRPSYGEPGRPVTPWGLRGMLNWFAGFAGNGWPIYIVENGIADTTDIDLNDTFRADFYKQHLLQVYKTIHLDGLDVRGFGFWSLMDNFEWSSGYTRKYGIVRVDFNSPQRTRTPKDSYHVLKKLMLDRGFSVNVKKLIPE